MTPSEKFVYDLCRKSFLSLWSVPNPRGASASHELCDVLVVCDPDIIIFSVKEIAYRPTSDFATGFQRWTSKAVEASAKQLYGAERALLSMLEIQGADGTAALSLPPVTTRRIHRVAVALGRKNEIPMMMGDFGKGFVHVLDETAVEILLRELNTITDFVDYLSAKEKYLEKGRSLELHGEEDLLAVYLQKERTFPQEYDALYLAGDIWAGFTKREEYLLRAEADRMSYFWDNLIEYLIANDDPKVREHLPDNSSSIGERDAVVRTMARERRFARRILAKTFLEFQEASGVRSRIAPSPSGVTYVFLACGSEHDRAARRDELVARCFIARGMCKSSPTVIGIATEKYEKGKGFSFDVCRYVKEEWTMKDQEQLETLQEQAGLFKSPRMTKTREYEYPGTNKAK